MKVWIRPLIGLQALAREVMKRGAERHLADLGKVSKIAYRIRSRVMILKKAIEEGFG